MRILALIPARGGSKRLPGKNVRPLLGLPLIGWVGRFALGSGLFDQTILSTDDAGIATAGRAVGLSVPWLRPADLASDTASSVDMALHAVDRAEADHGPFDALALFQPTNPFQRREPWLAARGWLAGGAPAVIGVAPDHSLPYHSFLMAEDQLTPLFPDALGKRGQDLPRTVHVTGGLYLIRTNVLRETRSFYPPGTRPVLCDHPLDDVDIDTAADFAQAEWLAAHHGISPPPGP